MWVEEAGDRGGGQAGKGLGCWSCSLGFTQWDLSWLSAWILEFESWLYHIPALYVPSGKFLTVSVP